MTDEPELKLDKSILDKAIKSGNEYGWRIYDFKEVIANAVSKNFAIIGGQVQFLFPDGTCELYWLKYDTKSKDRFENWSQYVKRTEKECIDHFETICQTTDFEKEGLVFDFIKEKKQTGINILDYMIFIIYLADETTRTN